MQSLWKAFLLVSCVSLCAACGDGGRPGDNAGALPGQQPNPFIPSTGTSPGIGASSSNGASVGHHRCGWIEGQDGIDSFVSHPQWYDEIHPFWYHLSADGATVAPYRGAENTQLLDAARANHVRMIPL